MMKCSNMIERTCLIASDLAGNPVLPTIEQCEFCTHHAEPKQSINKVTVSLAVVNAANANTRIQLLSKHGDFLKQANQMKGPGTELQKLISWFYVPDDSKCKCNDRIAKMNKWGPDGCEERMDTIVRWLKHSAATHNVPFQETVVRMLIKRAISNARKAV